MSIYVLITDQCLRDASTLGFEIAVQKQKEKLESIQNTSGLSRYPKPFLVKKFGKTGRLVIEEKFQGEDCVLCFLRFFARSDPEYWKNFLQNTPQFLIDNSPSVDIWKTYLTKRREKPVVSLPQLDLLEEAYLFSLDESSYHNEGSILESEDWVKRTQSSENSGFLSLYWQLLYSLVENDQNSDQTIIPNQRRTILLNISQNTKSCF